ncbi:hypothetical protein PPGU19_089650 (plasmid) [Paraburkholderia sp. PGU19]|nr:hypothetical protein PPGU19_089650 [Paraburkholderia sp. PGU19]
MWCNSDASVCYPWAFDDHEPTSKLKDLEWLFSGRRFDREVIVLCVRWYLRYKLSLRDLAEMMAERGLSLAHTTILRWVKRYTPEFVKRWNRLAAILRFKLSALEVGVASRSDPTTWRDCHAVLTALIPSSLA